MDDTPKLLPEELIVLSLATARELKESGLEWQPQDGDRFTVPDSALQDRAFVINDMAAMIERYRGFPVVTFHGTPEWALDFIWLGETVWLPSEHQLREMLAERLAAMGSHVYDLLYADGQFTCRFEVKGERLAFVAEQADEAYARALLHLMQQQK
jgi:hypothetical protein